MSREVQTNVQVVDQFPVYDVNGISKVSGLGTGFGPGALELDGEYSGILYDDPPLAAFQNTGTVEFRYRPDYDEYPPESQVIFFTTGTGGWFLNTFIFGHDPSGYLLIAIADSAGNFCIYSITDIMWTPSIGVWVPVEFGFDVTPGTGFGLEVFFSGVKQGTIPLIPTGVPRDDNTTECQVGDRNGAGTYRYFGLDELVLRDTVRHRANFTPPVSALVPPYDSDVLCVAHFNDVAGQSMEADYWRDGSPSSTLFGADTSIISVAGGDFVVEVRKNGVVQSTTVSIVEIGTSGEYKLAFTPDSAGFWVVDVFVAGYGQIWSGEYDVRDYFAWKALSL